MFRIDKKDRIDKNDWIKPFAITAIFQIFIYTQLVFIGLETLRTFAQRAIKQQSQSAIIWLNENGLCDNYIQCEVNHTFL